MWLPTTKTSLVNEIYYLLQWTYTRWEIERIYYQVYYKEPRRNKYYANKAWVKRLQAFLIQVRKDIKKLNKEVKKLKYNFDLI